MTNLYNYQESLDKLPDIVPIYVHALLLGGAAEMYSSLFLSLSDSLGAWEIWHTVFSPKKHIPPSGCFWHLP